jgi:uncharacterized repeat protein (TIGR03803 family)
MLVFRGVLVLAWLALAGRNARGIDVPLQTIYNFPGPGPGVLAPSSGVVSPGQTPTTLFGSIPSDPLTLFSIQADGTSPTFLQIPSPGNDTARGGGLTYYVPTLYGTICGNPSGAPYGAVFACSFSLDANSYSVLHTFNPPGDGANPVGGLLSFNRYLFGATKIGGRVDPSSGATGGTLFLLADDGSSYLSFPFFDPINTLRDVSEWGSLPDAGLVAWWNGTLLFGTTCYGGHYGYGTIFAFDTFAPALPSYPASNPPYGYGDRTQELYGRYALSVLHDFAGPPSDGGYPSANMIVNYADCYLYGTGASDYGTVFKIKINGTGYQTLHRFGGSGDGANPVGSLVLLGNTLYGLTTEGGANNTGTMFEISTSGGGYRVIHNFSALDASGHNAEGATPQAGLALAGSTFYDLYGTTTRGGANGWGTIFTPARSIILPGRLGPGTLPGGTIGVNWNDPLRHLTLQSAATVAGPFTNIVGATSPYTNVMTGPHRFLRLAANAVVPSPASPDAVTVGLTATGSTSATINGFVAPHRADTTVWFAYGPDTNYGSLTATSLVAGTNSQAVAISNFLSGLMPGTVYHYQLICSNSFGSDTGGDFSFTTPAAPTMVRP